MKFLVTKVRYYLDIHCITGTQLLLWKDLLKVSNVTYNLQHLISQIQSENPENPFELIKRIKQMTGNTLFLLHPWKRSANRRRCRIGERKRNEGTRGRGRASNGDYVKGSKLCTKKGE